VHSQVVFTRPVKRKRERKRGQAGLRQLSISGDSLGKYVMASIIAACAVIYASEREREREIGKLEIADRRVTFC